ncbi:MULTISPECIES: CRISPR-associated endoribonuclease Cas6 [unclassified Thermosipho (in: thermotogales)]|uniref:CRISPR-associated endoribonuclease Cas6 n=1 Tax=unclassified Thermosipho (in: thermotogales) TaxID=2676525 RepID=UPI0009847800|nr:MULTISPECIES: CRISPR-associated endoribonuclease Cas6 [unclassified Thermosipho (in: thermotogales)]MBT1247890.1 hypothetical protein [Thermosipho sp. 1244]OOC47411.1 hypothetical protein XO09_01520 [Thermosipho sp. 1223]
MIETYVFFKVKNDFIIENSSEKLHGLFFKILKNTKIDTEKLHSQKNKPFSISPVYEYGYDKSITKFSKNKYFFFRIASIQDNLIFSFVKALTLNSTELFLDKYPIYIDEVITETYQNKDIQNEITINFVSPVTFRGPNNINIPIPDPLHIINFLKKYGINDVDYPKITYIEGKSHVMKYSSFKLIGFVGKMRIKTHTPKSYLILHYLGTGYSHAKGMGVTIIDSATTTNQKIKYIWKRWGINA